MVRKGEFREDLWYRLNVFPINIPPLRTRREDIPALTEFLLQQKTKRLNLRKVPRLTPAKVDQLMAYDWPGNVRELDNVIERSLILASGREITFDGLLARPDDPRPESQSGRSTHKPRTLDEVTRNHIREVLNLVNGKVHGKGGAAELLGVNASTLRSRMNKLGIPFGRSATASDDQDT